MNYEYMFMLHNIIQNLQNTLHFMLHATNIIAPAKLLVCKYNANNPVSDPILEEIIPTPYNYSKLKG